MIRLSRTLPTDRRLPRRIGQLLLGLLVYGVGIGFVVRAQIGAAPWDVLTQGIAIHTGMSFGMITILTSAVVLVFWIPLRQRPGLGTVLNALLVGIAADGALAIIPTGLELWLRIPMFVIGLVVIGIATGLYIGARFGPGPRDGLMTGLNERVGWPMWLVRTGIEVIVVSVGWFLGGNTGLGTLAFAVGIGPLCQFFIKIFTVTLAQPQD